MKSPDPNSLRSKKRRSRGFDSLESSSRKHRRALKRHRSDATIGSNHIGNNGTYHKPGTKVDPPLQGKYKTFAETASGKLNYH